MEVGRGGRVVREVNRHGIIGRHLATAFMGASYPNLGSKLHHLAQTLFETAFLGLSRCDALSRQAEGATLKDLLCLAHPSRRVAGQQVAQIVGRHIKWTTVTAT